MKNILLIFGTRPEAIKMCPLVRTLNQRNQFRVTVCVTGQHRQMLDGVLDAFGVTPDYDLSIMREGQTLSHVTAEVLTGLDHVLARARPEIMLVHGDTSTAFSAALAGFYRRIPVGHVEAGLRTYDMENPFPEEFNRRSISLLAHYHFAPTDLARANLLREGIDERRVYVTGNTAIDALRFTVRDNYAHPLLDWAGNSRLILLTAHRRESLGAPMEGAFRAIRRVADEHPDLKILYPVHMNPAVRRIAEKILGDSERIRLTPPLEAPDFHNFMARSYLILTDSGGIQEEAPALGKPVLVLRDTTERPEGVAAGTLLLAGTREATVYRHFTRLLADETLYRTMAKAKNPYGDGFACQRIAEILAKTHPHSL